MKALKYLLIFLFGISNLLAQPVETATRENNVGTDPVEIFRYPPESAKPGVLWMWMGSNLSKEGITKDLEALKIEGFNRTTMFSLADITTPWAGVIKKSPTPELISWTEPWWKLVRHAAEESKRLGMDFGMFNGPSYESSGGIWITPEFSMQEICWSQNTVPGNRHISLNLQRPQVSVKGHTPYPIFNGATGLVEIPEVAARKSFYKDIATIAIPANGTVLTNDVINITANMQPDGKLEWDAPEGDWIIYRFGHTTTGTYIQPAQWEATGLECDKMSHEAVSFHMDHVIGEIQKHLGELVGTGITHVHFDSYEAGYPTWTAKMKEEFLTRRGYDLTPLLPIFAGHIIGSKQDSIKFRKDFEATVKDLYRDVYFTTISEKLKAAHLTFLCEPYGGPWRQDEIMPLVKNVMTEFWTHKGTYSPYELEPTVAALRKSGQNIIEAEAFTGDPSDSKWDETPVWLKPIGDAAFCDGVNRMVLHRFVQQAFDDRYKPGATMGRWGTHFDRTQTWWQPGKALVTYWQRCQALLQWGTIVLPAKNDFVVHDTSVKAIKYIHRNLQKSDLYFVANTARVPASASCSFKITGMQPELWDPVTGAMRTLPEFDDNQTITTIPLHFDAAQSFFIVFRKKAGGEKQTATKNFPAQNEIASINGPWKVQFDPVWGGPAKAVTFEKPEDWTMNMEKGIKYYSGTAVYKNSFDMPATPAGKKSIYLDLGMVNHIARVLLNGKDLGIIWTAPWQAKLPAGLLKNKNNQLIIEVTNVWANRLIGDEQEPADCEWIPGYISGGYSLKEFPDWFLNKQPRPSKGRYCFTTWNYFTKDSPLISSGLMGPVRIVVEE
ncbi:MAG: glycosyl hydrolase [Chitinophagaceae bacterium]